MDSGRLEKLIWSDETKINLHGNDGPGHKWIDLNETRLEFRNYVRAVKFSGVISCFRNV